MFSFQKSNQNPFSIREKLVFDNLAKIEFSCPKPYRVRSAKEVLDSGKAHALEFSLALAYSMEKFSYEQRIVDLFGQTRKGFYGHSIFILKKDDLYHSFSHSAIPQLNGYFSAKTKKAISNLFFDALEKRGVYPVSYLPYNPNKLKFDWRNSKEDLAKDFAIFRDKQSEEGKIIPVIKRPKGPLSMFFG
ncbi:MAG: hypothetical protein PVJ67_03180 [Candidatus Pacearchaeota archaeon]|jgi:hypothetical protein